MIKGRVVYRASATFIYPFYAMTSRVGIPLEMIADYFTLLSVGIPALPEETYVPFNRTIQRCWFTTWDNLKKLRIPHDDERYKLVEFWDKVGSMLEIDTQKRPSGPEYDDFPRLTSHGHACHWRDCLCNKGSRHRYRVCKGTGNIVICLLRHPRISCQIRVQIPGNDAARRRCYRPRSALPGAGRRAEKERKCPCQISDQIPAELPQVKGGLLEYCRRVPAPSNVSSPGDSPAWIGRCSRESCPCPPG